MTDIIEFYNKITNFSTVLSRRNPPRIFVIKAKHRLLDNLLFQKSLKKFERKEYSIDIENILKLTDYLLAYIDVDDEVVEYAE
jgi:hypothetical protein